MTAWTDLPGAGAAADPHAALTLGALPWAGGGAARLVADLARALPGLPGPVLAGLADSGRVHARLRAVWEGATACPDLPPVVPALACAPVPQLCAMAQRAGAVWHARAICRVVQAPERAALAAEVGGGALAFARAHREAAVATRVPPELGAAIRADGLACLHAWAMQLHPGIAARLALRLPEMAGTLDPAHHAHGPGLIRLAATGQGHHDGGALS